MQNKFKKHKSNIVSGFFVLKFFNIQIREGMVDSLINVIWEVSSTNFLKVNIDGTTRSHLGLATFIGIFKESQGEYMDSFF